MSNSIVSFANFIGVDVEDVGCIIEQLVCEAEEIAHDKLSNDRYTIAADTVFDTTTGLTWQREVSDQRFTWQEAKDYPSALKLDGGGWRLPTKEELLSIVDRDRSNPAIDVEVFPNTPSDWFWSASPSAYGSNYAWCVDFYDFYDGYSYSHGVSGTYRVRCVR